MLQGYEVRDQWFCCQDKEGHINAVRFQGSCEGSWEKRWGRPLCFGREMQKRKKTQGIMKGVLGRMRFTQCELTMGHFVKEVTKKEFRETVTKIHK